MTTSLSVGSDDCVEKESIVGERDDVVVVVVVSVGGEEKGGGVVDGIEI